METIKYIITDPCYLMSQSDWVNAIKTADSFHKTALLRGAIEPGYKGWSEFVNSEVKERLEFLSGHEAFVADTGCGDWDNALRTEDKCVGSFCADAGMVCVVQVDQDIVEAANTADDNAIGTIFEAVGKVNVEFDFTKPNWTVVKITDEAGNKWETLK